MATGGSCVAEKASAAAAAAATVPEQGPAYITGSAYITGPAVDAVRPEVGPGVGPEVSPDGVTRLYIERTKENIDLRKELAVLRGRMNTGADPDNRAAMHKAVIVAMAHFIASETSKG